MKYFGLRIFFAAWFCFAVMKFTGFVYAAQALQALEGGDWNSAAQKAELSLRWNQNNPKMLETLGLSYWYNYLSNKGLDKLKASDRVFRKLSEVMPLYSKVWLYRAWVQAYEPSGETKSLKIFLRKAQSLEPKNPWLAIETSLLGLRKGEAATGISKDDALKQIHWALSQHYRNQTSPYLEPTLNELWKISHQVDWMAPVIPDEAPSFEKWMQWLQKKKFWKRYAQDYSQWHELSRDFYFALIRRGDDFLRRGESSRALAVHRAAERWNSGYFDLEKFQKKKLEDPETRPSISPSTELPKNVWQGEAGEPKNRLISRGVAGVLVQLVRGRQEIEIFMKSEPSEEGEEAFVRIWLWNHNIPHFVGVAATTKEWQPYRFEVESTGGGRWLQVEFFNGSENKATSGPILWLGALKLRSIP
ncbi:MAG: hypothetical protein HYZ85_00725 [Candidatus Omnitrophica bacterium]|nr:hypothetical protein [Candidatus Omnitrophota bacterium]